MDIVGLCRFSYPALGGFQREHETLQERIEYLYQRTRLEHRFRLFETLCLPSIAAQTDQAFKFVILIGKDLPDWARDRLENLTRAVPMISIVAMPPIRHRTVAANVINDARNFDVPLCAQFRLDDDDAVNIHFVEYLKVLGQKLDPVFVNTHHFAVDFNNGFALHFDQTNAHIRSVKRPFWTPALAAFFRWETDTTIMNFTHNGIYKHMPCVTIPDTPMFIRSFHGENDSRPMALGQDPTFAPITTALADPKFLQFGIEHKNINRVWGALNGTHFVGS